ncbi:hypothetical protein MW887_004667 [Aspergillus wentii]|nr:hypothetical protein MW887_004667 [Aspergillus wentii]
MNEVGIPPASSPAPNVYEIEPGVRLLRPLSRRGIGPGMIILLPDGSASKLILNNGVPTPSLKWAEEAYVVIEIRKSAMDRGYTLNQAVESLTQHDQCVQHDTIGLVAYDSQLWEKAESLPGISRITAAAIYGSASDIARLTSNNIPTVQHLSGQASMQLQRTDNTMQYDYPNMSSQSFALTSSSDIDYTTEAVSHTRNLTFLKRHMKGPYFDLEAIWEEHTYFEFDNRIPGVPPTGRKLEIPFMAVVNIRGDRLYHEHITWDQATVLKQLGLMPEYLPYPYPLANGKRPAPGRSFEVRVPAAGAETAAKMRDKNAVPSNQLFTGDVREV